jgi:pimeloyl-ACP methyl ester carboxylesterase
VSFLLRAATLPGAEFVLPLLTKRQLLDAGRAVDGFLSRIGLRVRTDIGEMARGHATLADREARAAFVHTLRTIVDPGGQRVNASDRLYLAQHVPFLLIWGERDPVIPRAHGEVARAMVPGSRLEVFPESGHFPQLDEPQRFVEVLEDFIDGTEPADVGWDRWRQALREGAKA